MRNRLRRALVLVLACGLAIGIAACGGGGDADSSSSGSEEITGTVTVWDFEYHTLPEYGEAVDQIDAEFEQLHPGVEVERVPQPVEGYEALYRAAFTAREGPDVMVFQPGAAGVLSFKDGLEVLNDKLSPELQESVTQWESVTDGYASDGDHYGVPLGLQGWVFYYNKQLFAKAGLPTDFEPQSWDEVREAGEKLKAAGIQAFTGGDKEGFENGWWFSVGFQSENTPEQTLELANGEIPFTEEAVTKAFGPGIEMQEAGLYPADRFSTPLVPDGYGRFAEGKGAMTLGLWSATGYWGEFNPALGEENVGIFFAPVSSSGNTSQIAYGLPKFAENKDAALAFLEYMASKKGIEVLNQVGGFLPNRTDVELPGDAAVQARELVDASRQREAVVAPFIVVPAAVAFGTMATEMNQVLQGRTSLEDAQQAMQETAEKTAP